MDAFPLGVAGGLFSSARASVAEVQQTQNSKTPKMAVFLLKPKITRNMNYIAAELPNHWNSQTSEVPSAICKTRERNLSNNRSVNPPIKIFGNTVEKQKKH